MNAQPPWDARILPRFDGCRVRVTDATKLSQQDYRRSSMEQKRAAHSDFCPLDATRSLFISTHPFASEHAAE